MTFRDGVTRNLDSLGRLVIPMEMRRSYGINCGDRMQITTENDWIKIRKVEERCCVCDSDQDLSNIGEKLICRNCVEKIRGGQ